MHDYEYPDIDTMPNMGGIHTDVVASEMTDKDIIGCVWNEADEVLHVHWQRILSSGDEALLDTIVANNT